MAQKIMDMAFANNKMSFSKIARPKIHFPSSPPNLSRFFPSLLAFPLKNTPPGQEPGGNRQSDGFASGGFPQILLFCAHPWMLFLNAGFLLPFRSEIYSLAPAGARVTVVAAAIFLLQAARLWPSKK